MANTARGHRGLKLHSIIEKLSEQCERKSPVPDEDGEDNLASEVSRVKRKQRKRNGVKRVYKESSSEDGSSGEEVNVPSLDEEYQKNNNFFQQLEWKVHKKCVVHKGGASCQAAKRKRQTIQSKWHQNVPGKTFNSKNTLPTKIKKKRLELNFSRITEEPGSCGSEKDLDIDIDAFVNHVPVIRDVDQAITLSSCPFCSVVYEDITQHIKDCHNAECTVVDGDDGDDDICNNDNNEDDDEDDEDDDGDGDNDCDELSDSSYIPEDSSESDDDFTLDSKSRSKGKKQRQQNKMAPNESFPEGELCIGMEMEDSGMDNVDDAIVQSSTVTKLSDKASGKDIGKLCCSCKGCAMRFGHWDELRKHFESKPECRKLYQCDECDEICVPISFLKKHKLLHSKKPKEPSHKCSVCDAVFTQKAYLKRHAVIHTGIKEFECDFCHKMFARQRSLKEHRRRHTGEKPYKCKYCEAAFTNSSSLRAHTTKHTGIRQYKCQTCGKMFAKSYGLKMHAVSHSNDKPFVCEVCGKAFKRPDHFKQHKIIHSDSKPFKCDTCQRTFNQKVCLRKHLPCREHEKKQKKLQKSQPVKVKARNKPKSSVRRSSGGKKSAVSKANSSECPEATKGSDCFNVTNDVSLSSSVEASMSARSYSPPSFVRPMPKLIDNEYYSVSSENSYQHERDMNSLLSLPHSMFSCVEDALSLDSLPPLSTHVTQALTGRPLIVDNSTDLGSVLLSSAMSPENLSSIVEEASSLFGQDRL